MNVKDASGFTQVMVMGFFMFIIALSIALLLVSATKKA